MLEIIKNLFSKVKDSNFLNYLIGVILLGLVIYLFIDRHRINNDYIKVSNQLADTDFLHRVSLENNKSLSERYARQDNDLIDKISENKELKNYLEQKDATILTLTKTVSEFKITNEEITGALEKDSLGFYANFIKITPYYSIDAIGRLQPRPLLHITNFSVSDSTWVGITGEESGIIKGFIQHANPYILDKDGVFSIIPKKLNDIGGIDWMQIGIGAGFGVTITVILTMLAHR